MKYTLTLLTSLWFIVSLHAQTIDQKVEATLAKMSLKEKVGQMTQLSIDMIAKGQPFNLDDPIQIDEEKLKTAIQEYGVGSILNVGGHAYTREQWYVIHQAIDKMVQETNLKVPIIYGIDAIHGMNYTSGSTLFPQQLGQAATWNPALVEKGAAVTAYECRASGIPWNFAPVLDVMRQPLWSRVFETFGEDPYLVSTLGAAYIRGNEGGNVANKYRVAACMKHYLGYSYPFSGKDRTPAYIPDWMLREIFLPPFQSAVDAGAHTIMINSAEINGIPTHMNSFVLKTLLRDELGFTGVAVSDWEDIILLHTRHRVAATEKDATKFAVNAGIDMSMVPMGYTFSQHLVELVNEGEVSMARIDEAVSRILKLKYELGLFDKVLFDFDDYPKFASEEHAAIARQAALESITLLKNENNLLPLDKSKKILVTGAAANSMMMLNGSWSRTWQGTNPSFDVKTPGKLTIVEAIKREIGAAKVSFVEGSTADELVNLEDAISAAKEVDAIMVCVGETPATEKPGDIDDLDLSDAQLDLVKGLVATGKPIILVLVENRPRIIREIEPLVGAIVQCYQPGDEGGPALAEIVYGDHNPEGRLPYTYPRYANDLVTYDHKGTEKIGNDFGPSAFFPQYEFGFGLSYTTFAYSNLSLDQSTLSANAKLKVSITVKNTGKRMGREVVQFYTQDMYASVSPPSKKLRDFRKITLLPGESRTLTFMIEPAQLAFWGADGKWITEAGEFKVMVGGHEATFNYQD
ncbi:MAG: glycoside hydrolase family 3 N-terminal domain-containing protein [Bacteroidia bacterium]